MDASLLVRGGAFENGYKHTVFALDDLGVGVRRACYEVFRGRPARRTRLSVRRALDARCQVRTNAGAAIARLGAALLGDGCITVVTAKHQPGTVAPFVPRRPNEGTLNRISANTRTTPREHDRDHQESHFSDPLASRYSTSASVTVLDIVPPLMAR